MTETWTVLRILQWTAEHFQRKGIESGRRDAELLLGRVLGLDRVGLYLQFDRPLDEDERSRFRQLLERRAAREPLQYILGKTEFWSREFAVSPAVLIPRADTEVLVEEALARRGEARTALDIGTGSGVIAVALALEVSALAVTAIDLSAAALEVAAQNAASHGVKERIRFREESLAEVRGTFDLVVSNPPYIAEAELAALMPEVRDHEPRLALAAGVDGLDAYRLLAARAAELLAPGGWLLVEVGLGQAQAVAELWRGAGLNQIFCRDDYAGIPRVVGGRREG